MNLEPSNTSSGQPRMSVIIVGAGVGGTALAARLARAGLDVTVVEKNSFTGGRCSLIHRNGYRFDQGPSLLLMPEFFNEVFEDLGTKLGSEGVQLLRCNPNYEIYFHDGHKFCLSSDLTQLKTEVERYEGVDGFSRLLGFLQEAHEHYELSSTHVLRRNFTSLFSMMRPSFLSRVFALHPFESIYTRASVFFRTERLRRVFTFGSMYLGMSPFDAPGTYSLLQYAETVRGIWYPVGGFHKVVEAFVNIGKRHGVNYRMSTSVTSINVNPITSQATGVTLSTGESLSASLVVINADLVYAYSKLLPPSSYATSLTKRTASCSSISFYWSLREKIPTIQTHNIFLAEEYRESFDSIFQKQEMPSDPSFYVNIPSRVDPTAAPEGKDAVVVLVPVGHMKDPTGIGLDEKWSELVDKARSMVIATVRARTGIDLQPLIIDEEVNSPLTWKEKFNLDRGAILGLSHSFFNVLSFRPTTAHPSIADLYFCGASTHPGTGVPVCLAGAKITAEQILNHEKIPIPWASDERKVGQRTSPSVLDMKEKQAGFAFLSLPQFIMLFAVLTAFLYGRII